MGSQVLLDNASQLCGIYAVALIRGGAKRGDRDGDGAPARYRNKLLGSFYIAEDLRAAAGERAVVAEKHRELPTVVGGDAAGYGEVVVSGARTV